MKSSSIALDDDDDDDNDDDDDDEERGARKTDRPIYNAVKPTMRVMCVRLAHTARIPLAWSRYNKSPRSIRVSYVCASQLSDGEIERFREKGRREIMMRIVEFPSREKEEDG